MSTTLTSKGQVTIPKRIRDALRLLPGSAVEFSVNAGGDVILHPPRISKANAGARKDRFDAARGRADIKWRTDDLMKLLRSGR
jgi:antitoxin PrlF